MNKRQDTSDTDCGFKTGALPDCAPLALAYVPMQSGACPAYEPADALARGTLFPGLDLPFMNIVNRTPGKTTPLTELMALDFVLDELELYLDTHSGDAEAFETWKCIAALAKEARKRYVALYGPVTQTDMESCGSFTWLDNPWPWNYCPGAEV